NRWYSSLSYRHPTPQTSANMGDFENAVGDFHLEALRYRRALGLNFWQPLR
ncbi:jg25795, partial [Pararge aegeria aegeria]